MSPTQIVAARLTFGAMALGIAVRFFGVARYPHGVNEWRVVAGQALISNVIPFALFAWGEERVTSSLASVMNATTPLWTAALAALALVPGERLNLRRGAGLFLGMLGVIVILQPWNSGGGEVLGELACLGAGTMYGVGIVYTSKFISGRIPPMTAAVGQVTAGAAIAVVIAVATTIVNHDTMHLEADIVLSVVTLGAVGTGLAFLLFMRLIEMNGPTAASTVTFLMPIVGVLLGVVVLDEKVGWNVAFGGVVVIAGVLLVRRVKVDAPGTVSELH